MHKPIFIALTASLLVAACDSQTKTEDNVAEKAPEPAQSPEKADKAEEPKAEVKLAELKPDEVEALVNTEKCVPVDANGQQTREKYGTLPGAVLLSGSNFEVTELPEDKAQSLVFYCGGPSCMAAPNAAKKALAAGYVDVKVMRDGIKGWVEAGKTVEKS